MAQTTTPQGDAMTTTITLPKNPVTGREYTRGNADRLHEAATIHGYESGQWATFRQWRQMGRTVLRGEHGVKLLLPKVERTDDGEAVSTGKIVKGFTVFALEQTGELA